MKTRARGLIVALLVATTAFGLMAFANRRALRVRWYEHRLLTSDYVARDRTISARLVAEADDAELERFLKRLTVHKKDGYHGYITCLCPFCDVMPHVQRGPDRGHRVLAIFLRVARDAADEHERAAALLGVHRIACALDDGDSRSWSVHHKGDLFYVHGEHGFAATKVPPIAVFAYADRLIEWGHVDRTILDELGVRPVVPWPEVSNLGLELRELAVAAVRSGSPAAAAGLRPGDCFDSLPDESELGPARERGEKSIAFQVWRDGEWQYPEAPMPPAGVDLGIELRRRLLVSYVYPDLPARAAGVSNGDVLLAVNDERVDSWKALVAALRGKRRIVLMVERRGNPLAIPIDFEALWAQGAR